jgi:HAD superfamily phosphatase (TIGR01668 family)
MSKITYLQPDLILGETIIGLTPNILQHYRLKGLVLDVDETLVPLRERKVSEQLSHWIAQIKEVAEIWLVSNNISENRIGSIAQSLNVPYILGAGKPSRRKLRQAVEAMKLPASEIAMVGDRLFTDVIAGNRLGMFTILVEPMVDPAIAARSYPIRNFEVWFSQILGVSLAATQRNFTKHDGS